MLRYLGLLSTIALVSACADDEPAGDDEVGSEDTDDTDDEVGPTDGEDSSSDGSTSDTGTDDTDDTDDTDTTDTTDDTDTTDTDEPGDPLPSAPVGEWLYIELEGMMCRDGSPAGLAVRYADADAKLGIYFEGGGACFNSLTCLANPSSVAPGKFEPGPFGGIFDNENPDNPMMDYNFIYMPYCTGDVFFGTNPNGNVPGGPQNQKFVGHENTIIALERIVDTFPNATQVVALGQSGGGFGAASNYDTIASYFAGKNVTLVDDSGPIFTDQYLAPCLQQTFRDVWGIDASLPQDCSACFGPNGGGLSNYLLYIHDKYPNAIKTLISSEADATISGFYGFGNNNCSALFPSFPQFEEALYNLRDNVLTTEDWGSFILNGNSHTYLDRDNTLYGTQAGGVVLDEWLTDVLDGVAYHVSP
ncbi:MAG: hypothetical protein HC927_02325 [Deltaproteobacteria bacterium]|nr:hypothetical protein [Deltaproteobacteria bacterium]